MSARLSSLLVALPLALTGAPTQAHAAPPSERRAKRSKSPPPVGELSRQATRHGELEFGLASVMVGVGLGLVAFGSIELVRTREHQRFCNNGYGGSGIDPCVFDPPALGYAAVGLSWAIAVPVLIGSGLLFARGASVRSDARRFARTSVAPWWHRTGGGVSFTLRF
ncbi:hypothetical protein ACNOYE_08350 [Nannocystaceae bacterium ST9]